MKAVTALLLLTLMIGCKSIEYRDREAPEYLKAGCKAPEPYKMEVVADMVIYIERLRATIKECDARIKRFTGRSSE